MKKILIGNSSLELTPITFGAWAIGGWMWGGADKKDAIDAIDAAIDAGMTSIDTAPVYGFGQSEELVGKAIQGKRNKVQILTKYGLRWDTSSGDYYFDTVSNEGDPLKVHKYASKESIIKECEQSLQRLGTDYIDLYQIHWPDTTTPVEESMEAVSRLIEQGKVLHAGVCNYNTQLSQQAFDALDLVSNQVPYSMVNRGIEEELVPWSIKNKVAILAYSPLQRGLLTGKITPDYHFEKGDARPDTPFFKPDNLTMVNDFLNKIKPIAEEHNASLGQLVTAWTIAQPGITVALVGARTAKQVLENAKAAEINLHLEEITQITSELNKLHLTL
jgi:aryl-alcohol dehydrogenase-like predicted oxidoreductase